MRAVCYKVTASTKKRGIILFVSDCVPVKKIFSCVLILTRYSVHCLHPHTMELDINNNETSYHKHTKGELLCIAFRVQRGSITHYNGCGVPWYRLREITNTNTTSTQTHAAHSFGRVDPSSRSSTSPSVRKKMCCGWATLILFADVPNPKKKYALTITREKAALSCL